MKKIFFLAYMLILSANFAFANTENNPCFLNLATMPNEVCVGQTLTMMVTTPDGIPMQSGNGYLFYWSDQGGQPGPPSRQITPTTPGNFSLTVQVSHISGCATSMTGLATVTSGSFLNLSVEPSTICFGESSTLTVKDNFGNPLPNGFGWTFQWSNGANTPSITVTPGIGTHNYTVTVTESGGCTQVMPTQTVTVRPSPTVSIMKYDLTNGGAILDAGFSPNTSYEWSTGEEGQTTIVLTPGIYTVTATNEFGCSKVATCHVSGFQTCDPETIYVEVPIYVDTCIGGPEPCTIGAQIHSTGNQTSICENDELDLTVNVTGAQGQLLYNWNNGKVTKTITIKGGGDYRVTVTDQNGCTAVAAFWVDEKSAPDAWVAIDQWGNKLLYKEATLCIDPGENQVNALQVLFVSVANLNSIEEIDWFPSGGQSTNNQQSYSYYLYPGVYDFQATVRGKNGCSTVVSFHITVEHCGCCGLVGTEDTTGVMEEELKVEFFNTLGQKVEGELQPFIPYLQVTSGTKPPYFIHEVKKFAILEN